MVVLLFARSRHHGMSVSWLRRTEYISTEQTRFQPQTMDKVEAKVGFSIKKNFKVLLVVGLPWLLTLSTNLTFFESIFK